LPCAAVSVFSQFTSVKVYPELINSTPIKPEVLKGVDMMVVRELTGGLYFAKPKKQWTTARGRKAVDTLAYSEQEIARIVRVGFELAQERRKKLTSVDKANVLQSSRLWRQVANEVAADYPDVKLDHISSMPVLCGLFKARPSSTSWSQKICSVIFLPMKLPCSPVPWYDALCQPGRNSRTRHLCLWYV
jgi:hypothetical protein